MIKVISNMWTEVTFLIGLSGGMWYYLEPPIQYSGVISGFVGLVVLSGALGLRVILTQWGSQRILMVVLCSGFIGLTLSSVYFTKYIVDRSNLVLTVEVGNNEKKEIIRGLDYLDGVVEKGESDVELLKGAGFEDGKLLIWTRKSIIEAERTLAKGYVQMAILTLFSSFLILEALRKSKSNSRETLN